MSAPEQVERWHRLSPLSPLVALGRGSVALLVIAVPALVAGRSLQGLAYYAPILGILIVSAVVRWRVTKWRVRGGVLEKEEGLIRRNSLRFPLTQIQAIDVVRPGAARLFGLAELRLRMGGSTLGSARLAYLPLADAVALRTRLLHSDAPATNAAEAPAATDERVIVTTPTPRLLAGLVLSDVSIPFLVGLAVVAAFVGIGPGAIVYVVGLGASGWRRFNDEYHLNVAEAHDGMHVQGGLVATNAETIRRGRVQAVKVIEPFLWRPFGWCRLQVVLAGRQRSGGEGSAQRRSARTLLPVGSRQQADELLDLLLPARPVERLPPPRRARLKTPLRYRNLSWGHTESCVVTSSGRLTRVTSWVPLEKVQSLRRVEGPVQRRLRLATIHLDTAGRGVRAALRDRDRGEADRDLAELVDLCRQARR